jgi:membrane-associated protein
VTPSAEGWSPPRPPLDIASHRRVCDGPCELVAPAALTARRLRAGAAATGVALAAAIAAGVVAVPDLAGAMSDAADSVGAWIYLAGAVLIFLETTALVGFVIHGELVLLLAGVAAERGDASLPAVIVVVWAAAVAGDVVSLLLGRRLGRPFLERHGARVRIGAPQLVRIDGFFTRHGGKALVLGRFTGFLRATMPFVAGSSGVTLRRLLPFSAASGLVWTATFTLLGYGFGDAFGRAGDTATRVALVSLLLVTAALTIRSRSRANRASGEGGIRTLGRG